MPPQPLLCCGDALLPDGDVSATKGSDGGSAEDGVSGPARAVSLLPRVPWGRSGRQEKLRRQLQLAGGSGA